MFPETRSVKGTTLSLDELFGFEEIGHGRTQSREGSRISESTRFSAGYKFRRDYRAASLPLHRNCELGLCAKVAPDAVSSLLVYKNDEYFLALNMIQRIMALI
jgi:hypothetical protein